MLKKVCYRSNTNAQCQSQLYMNNDDYVHFVFQLLIKLLLHTMMSNDANMFFT